MMITEQKPKPRPRRVYRSRIGILYSLLKALYEKGPSKISHICVDTHLSYYVTRERLEVLCSAGFVNKNRSNLKDNRASEDSVFTYSINELGMNSYRSLTEFDCMFSPCGGIF